MSQGYFLAGNGRRPFPFWPIFRGRRPRKKVDSDWRCREAAPEGAKARGLGAAKAPSGVQGQSPGGGQGAKPPENFSFWVLSVSFSGTFITIFGHICTHIFHNKLHIKLVPGV